MSAIQDFTRAYQTERFEVRDCQPSDAAALQAVFNSNAHLEEVDAIFAAWGIEEYEKLIGQSLAGKNEDGDEFRLQVIADKSNGEIVAYYHFLFNRPDWEDAFISMFVVKKDLQNQKIAGEVLRGFIQQLRRHPDIKRLKLGVHTPNRDALAFWVRKGFTEIVRYFKDRNFLILSQPIC